MPAFHWFICVLVIVAVYFIVRAWKDNKEKPHLYFAVLVIVIVLILPCILGLFGLAGYALPMPGH